MTTNSNSSGLEADNLSASATTNPLDQLRDIHMPPEPEAWPPSPGWWATLITVVILFFIGRKIWQTWQRHRRDKRFVSEARKILADIERRFEGGMPPEPLASELSVLVRRVFLTLFNRRHVAGLHGDEWLAMLARTTSNSAFAKELKSVYIEAPYRSQMADGEFAERFSDALAAVDNWLQVSTRKPGEET